MLLLVAFAALQARRSRRGQTPLVEPSILRRRPYVAGLAVVVGFIGAMGGMMIALNVMFQGGLGFTPLDSGVATVSVPLAAIAGSITSSALLARFGRATMHIGLITMAVGLVTCDLVMRGAGASLTAWSLVAPLALTGFGMGMVFVPMFDVILAGVAPARAGLGLGAAGVRPAAGHVRRDRRRRHRAVRSARRRPRRGAVRRRGRPRSARRGGAAARGGRQRSAGCPATRGAATDRDVGRGARIRAAPSPGRDAALRQCGVELPGQIPPAGHRDRIEPEPAGGQPQLGGQLGGDVLAVDPGLGVGALDAQHAGLAI